MEERGAPDQVRGTQEHHRESQTDSGTDSGHLFSELSVWVVPRPHVHLDLGNFVITRLWDRTSSLLTAAPHFPPC